MAFMCHYLQDELKKIWCILCTYWNKVMIINYNLCFDFYQRAKQEILWVYFKFAHFPKL